MLNLRRIYLIAGRPTLKATESISGIKIKAIHLV
jgi:hypothetical protein